MKGQEAKYSSSLSTECLAAGEASVGQPRLLPCPFDGSAVSLRRVKDDIWSIWCPACHVSIGETSARVYLTKWWNTRAVAKAAVGCACVIVTAEDGTPDRIVYCPLHTARSQPDAELLALLDEVDAYFGWRLSDGDANGLHHQIPHDAIKAVARLSRELRARLPAIQ